MVHFYKLIVFFCILNCIYAYLPYAISNRRCDSECTKWNGKYNYYFCSIGSSWNYCSPSMNVDYYGNECKEDHSCQKYGYTYEWCYLKKGSWGYCSNGLVDKMKVLHFILILSLLINLQLTFASASGQLTFASSSGCQSGYDEISLYGGQKVFGASHHVFVLLRSLCGTYRLLEVGKASLYISINDQIGSTKEEALAKRNNKDSETNGWGAAEYVKCPYQSVQNVIYEYGWTHYDALNNNCRSFVNSLYKACGSNKRTTSGEVFASFFDSKSDGKNNCCNIFSTTCCCRYSDGSIHSFHSWGKHGKCFDTNHCNLGWMC